MDKSAIELQLRQVEDAFSKSKINVYSDSKKELHFNELYAVYEAIAVVDLNTFNNKAIEYHYSILEYILNGLEYLDSSTLNVIPYELVSCLEFALDEWIKKESFIIVTSLSNRHLEYAFSTKYNSEYFNQINLILKSRYNLSISNRLIRIILPKSLSRDYLSSVVLYHELGHFIDMEYSISQKIVFKKYLTQGYPPNISKELSHLMEFFADIFAAQYINQSSNYFLERITLPSQNVDSESHPATSERISVVDKFLTGNVFDLLENFNSVLEATGLPFLTRKNVYIDPNSSDFINLIPQEITTVQELHGIFNLAWDLWLSVDFDVLNNFSLKQKYHVINNLVEKSISNYTVVEHWKNSQISNI